MNDVLHYMNSTLPVGTIVYPTRYNLRVAEYVVRLTRPISGEFSIKLGGTYYFYKFPRIIDGYTGFHVHYKDLASAPRP